MHTCTARAYKTNHLAHDRRTPPRAQSDPADSRYYKVDRVVITVETTTSSSYISIVSTNPEIETILWS